MCNVGVTETGGFDLGEWQECDSHKTVTSDCKAYTRARHTCNSEGMAAQVLSSQYSLPYKPSVAVIILTKAHLIHFDSIQTFS